MLPPWAPTHLTSPPSPQHSRCKLEKPVTLLQPSLMSLYGIVSLFSIPFPLPEFHFSPTSSPNPVGFPYFESAPLMAAGFIFQTIQLIMFPFCSKTPDVSHCLQNKTQAHKGSSPSSWEMKSCHLRDCSHFSTCLDAILPLLCLSNCSAPCKVHIKCHLLWEAFSQIFSQD